MRPRRPKQYCLQLVVYIYIYTQLTADSTVSALYIYVYISSVILKDISAAALSKTKVLQRELHFQREHLFRDNEEAAAETIWRQIKERMVALEIALKKKARHKFSLATPLHPLQLDQTIQPSNTRRRTRRFERIAQRNVRAPTRNDSSGVTTEANLPYLNPINLTSSELTDAERSLLKKGPAFCPVPKDVNWQKVTDDMDKFERRIRLAIFFHGRNAEDNPRIVDDRFPAIPSAYQWLPPKSIFPEVEVFLNNVKIDILKLANLRTSKDNLTREERVALRSLKSSENIIRIQDKGSRFVVLSQQEY